MTDFKITSASFKDHGPIPSRNTCDGQDTNPPLQWNGAPAGTKTLTLIVDDPDAPGGIWVHWVLWNIPPDTHAIAEHSVPKGALQGVNDFRKQAYGGPCPPSGTHRYFFTLYALDTVLHLGQKAAKPDLEKAMKGHILAKAQLVGTYQRK